MRCITIQRKEVVEYLRKNKIYHVPMNSPLGENLIKPYKFMMKHYGYKYRPIFMCVVGHNCNFGGACTQGTYIIEMEIPDRYCKLQHYYNWSDFIYFTELPEEWEPWNRINTVRQFGYWTLDLYKNKKPQNDDVIQVTTQFINRNWIKKIIPMNEQFDKMYVDNGGVNVLQSIM